MIRSILVFLGKYAALGMLLLANQAWAFPMKPDIKALLDQAKQPRPHYVPARAGWNRPEEKPVTAVNPTYEELRKEPSPAELRQEFVTAAVPDWRVLLAIVALIAGIRFAHRTPRRSKVKVLAFPVVRPAAGVQEAA